MFAATTRTIALIAPAKEVFSLRSDLHSKIRVFFDFDN
jgi:hypothetical protein